MRLMPNPSRLSLTVNGRQYIGTAGMRFCESVTNWANGILQLG